MSAGTPYRNNRARPAFIARVWICAALVSCAAAQRSSFEAGENPAPVAPGIVAAGLNFGGALTPDGRQLYFDVVSADPASGTWPCSCAARTASFWFASETG